MSGFIKFVIVCAVAAYAGWAVIWWDVILLTFKERNPIQVFAMVSVNACFWLYVVLLFRLTREKK